MKAKILIVEDDPDISKILKDQLELDGYDVETAASGKEGLEKFNKFLPDLIILDLNLPDIDGLRVCKTLREKSNIPIIMLTVRDSISDKLRGFECGADDYVTKPFEFLELAARIKVHLARSQKQKPQDYDFGYLKMHTIKKEVLVNGKPVRLTRREFELLELLVANAGRVLSREFIKSQLWPNKELYPWSRAIDVHIKRLREKIEPDPENPRIIVTYPGIGYKFEPPQK